MIGAVQLGLLAACVVLFVPLGMAGWHLSRNKILFFSGALFITLAVGVHLMPYLSPPDDLIPRPIAARFTDSCLRSLHRVAFADAWRECGEIRCAKKSWNWIDSDEVARCEFQKLTKRDASDLLNGSWIVVAGDSQARLIALSLLNLVLGSNEVETIREDLFKRHSDYSIVANEIGMKLDFVWAPYAANLSDYVSQLIQNAVNSPDVLAMGAGLWDMLHINNATEYGISLKLLRDNLASISRTRSLRHLFWIGMPKLINSMLTTPEKKQKMTTGVWNLYQNQLLTGSRILKQSGGPLLNLDIHLLSSLCGEDGTEDGMHYDDSVYDAAVHIMLNTLLIQSNQKPHRRLR